MLLYVYFYMFLCVIWEPPFNSSENVLKAVSHSVILTFIIHHLYVEWMCVILLANIYIV